MVYCLLYIILSKIMLSEVKPKLSPLINFVAKPFSKINPNILSIVGLIFPVLFFVFMAEKNLGLALVMLFGTVFDTIDGAVARLTNRITKFGGLLDSTLDRLADALCIIAFYYAGIISIELALIVLVESYLISYIRSRAELAAKGEMVLNVGIIERPERVIAFILALICAFDPISKVVLGGFDISIWIFIVLTILSFITILQRILIAQKRL